MMKEERELFEKVCRDAGWTPEQHRKAARKVFFVLGIVRFLQSDMLFTGLLLPLWPIALAVSGLEWVLERLHNGLATGLHWAAQKVGGAPFLREEIVLIMAHVARQNAEKERADAAFSQLPLFEDDAPEPFRLTTYEPPSPLALFAAERGNK